MRSTADKRRSPTHAAGTFEINRETAGIHFDVPGAPREQLHLRFAITAVFWLAVILLGGLQSWASRHLMNTDGISYLDIAGAVARGDGRAAIHAYWSPLYPCLLALVLKLFKPSPYWEFTVVHAVNFLVFLGAAAAFQLFMSSLLRHRHARAFAEASRTWTALPDWALLILADSLFLWSSLALINLAIVSPDLLVSLFVFLACAIVIRMNTRPTGPGGFALLGFVLGFGYLAKTPMLPLGLVFLACAAFAACDSLALNSVTPQSLSARFRQVLPSVALGCVTFMLVAVPFIAGISKSKGYLTIGYNAPLNWAWNINHAPRYHWQGDVPGLGTPLHSTKKLFDAPAVYAFDGPVGGTYPVWYDPSYWFAGIRLSMDFRSVLHQFSGNSRFYASILFRRQFALAAACSLLFVFGWRGKRIIEDLQSQWMFLVPAVVGLLMYALVYVETRYIAAFIVLLWLGLFSAIRVPRVPIRERVAESIVVIAAALMALSLAFSFLKPAEPFHARALLHWKTANVQYDLAERLLHTGLDPGDKVAWIRPSIFDLNRRYDWAHLAGLRIIAEIPGSDEARFWNANPAVQSGVLDVFRGTGAKALIVTQRLNAPSALPWRPVGETGYYILFLRN